MRRGQGGELIAAEIPLEDVEVKEQLGHGAFGRVYRGKLRGQEIAIKKPQRGMERAIRSELAFLTLLQHHPNFIKCLGYINVPPPQEEEDNDLVCDMCEKSKAILNCDDCALLYCRTCGTRFHKKGNLRKHALFPLTPKATSMPAIDDDEGPARPGKLARVHRRRGYISAEATDAWIVMELVTGGNLCQLLHAADPPEFEKRLVWAREIALALAMLHQVAILHRDLTAENILCTADERMKISDFGFAVDAELAGYLRVLPKFKPVYAAPEVWNGEPFVPSSDVYSYGVVLYEICTLLDPHTALRTGHGVIPGEEQGTSVAPPPGRLALTEVALRERDVSKDGSERGPISWKDRSTEAGAYTEHSSVSGMTDIECYSDAESLLAPPIMRLAPLSLPESCPYELRAIIAQCWAEATSRRPTAPQILALLPTPEELGTGQEEARVAAAAALLAGEADGGNARAEFRFLADVPHFFVRDGSPVTTVAFARRSSSTLAYALMDGTINIVHDINVEDIEPTTITLEGHTQAVADLDWSGGNDYLLTCSTDKTARVWDVDRAVCLRIMYEKDELFCCRFSPQNPNLFVTGSMRKEVKVYNMSTGKSVTKATVNAPVSAVCFDTAGTHSLFVGSAAGTIYTYEVTSTGQLRQVYKVGACRARAVTSLAYTVQPTGHGTLRHLLLANCKDNSVQVYEVEDQAKLRPLTRYESQHSSLVIRSEFCPGQTAGQCFVTGSENGTVTVFDADCRNMELACVRLLAGHEAPVVDVTWSNDAQLLVSADVAGSIALWKRKKPLDRRTD